LGGKKGWRGEELKKTNSDGEKGDWISGSRKKGQQMRSCSRGGGDAWRGEGDRSGRRKILWNGGSRRKKSRQGKAKNFTGEKSTVEAKVPSKIQTADACRGSCG